MNSKEIGKIGENIASKTLLDKGYLILSKNHKEGFNEIDIIARSPMQILVFCEVKTLNNGAFSYREYIPEDNLNTAKYRKMLRASELFIARHPGLVYEDKGWQMDLIAIVLKNEKFFDLRHYENI